MIDQVGGSLAGADVPPPIAEKGLAAAPSHIFTRVGYWSNSIASNLEAALGWWEKCAGKKSYSNGQSDVVLGAVERTLERFNDDADVTSLG